MNKGYFVIINLYDSSIQIYDPYVISKTNTQNKNRVSEAPRKLVKEERGLSTKRTQSGQEGHCTSKIKTYKATIHQKTRKKTKKYHVSIHKEKRRKQVYKLRKAETSRKRLASRSLHKGRAV